MSDEYEPAMQIGAATTIQPITTKIPPREFPPGFHVAAPGPSHDEAPKPRRKRPA